MNFQTVLIIIIIGLVTGSLSGLIGIGGGIIMIPALVFFAGLSQHESIGTSLAVMLPPIGLFAAYNYYKEGFVNLKFAAILAVAFIVGSYFSSKIAVQIPENMIRRIFSVLLLVIAVKMFFSK